MNNITNINLIEEYRNQIEILHFKYAIYFSLLTAMFVSIFFTLLNTAISRIKVVDLEVYMVLVMLVLFALLCFILSIERLNKRLREVEKRINLIKKC